MKVLILTILGFLTLALLIVGKILETNLGASKVILDPVTSEVNAIIKAEQDLSMSEKGEYKYIPETVLPDGTKYRVDSIVKWNGEGNEPDRAYQVYITNVSGQIKSYGEGFASTTLNADWQDVLFIDLNSSTPIM
jgi:hypothetical protein